MLKFEPNLQKSTNYEIQLKKHDQNCVHVLARSKYVITLKSKTSSDMLRL